MASGDLKPDLPSPSHSVVIHIDLRLLGSLSPLYYFLACDEGLDISPPSIKQAPSCGYHVNMGEVVQYTGSIIIKFSNSKSWESLLV